jgi:hypothetical protein
MIPAVGPSSRPSRSRTFPCSRSWNSVISPCSRQRRCGVDAAPGGKVRGHRPPGDPARDQVADRVEQLAVAVALGFSVSGARPTPAATAGWPPTPRPSCPTDTGVPDRAGQPHCRTRAPDNHSTEQTSRTGRARTRTTTTPGPSGTARSDSHPRATERPCLHVRTTGRSPRRETCSAHTFRDQLRHGF